ncbi:hypothetical protein [Dysgonomonas reticulitermitis]
MNLKTTLGLLCFFALLLSCKKNVTVCNDVGLLFDVSDESISVPLGGFYQSSLQGDSTYVSLYAGDGFVSYFYSDTLNRVYAAKCKLGAYGVDTLSKTLILENEWAYLTIDSSSFEQVTVLDQPYLYFSTTEGFMGQAIIERNVNFHLLDMNTLEHYRLLYAGEPSFKCEDCIEGRFVITDQLRSTPEILDKLKEMSKTSKFIYQRGAKDDDIYYYLNYEEKWGRDNKSHNRYAAGYGDIVTPIRSTYYQADLFTLNKGSENSVIENGKYLFRSYFRGNIIGYNKDKKLYFPLYIENCVLGCDKDIEFVDENTLRITRSESDEEAYSISMKDILFDSTVGD